MTLWATGVIVLMALTTPGCSEETEMKPSIREVRARHVDRLMTTPGVVSVGIGRDDEGTAVIVVGFDQESVDAMQSLPTTLEGYAVRTEVVGRLSTE